jgi:hypothetical protein
MAWITAEAEALLADFMAEAWTDSEATDWARDYTSEGRFILEDTDGSRWITLTAARVPCERVDRFLAKQDDPGFGKPDRCDRWLRAAAQSMTKYGITDRTPGEFLKQINADLRVRVMLVYAGWYKDPNRPERIQLVDARPVIVYPETGFTEERREAEHAVFQAMKIGSDSHLEP